jgi:hypothetical protein
MDTWTNKSWPRLEARSQSTYRWRQDDEQDCHHDPSHAEKETNQAHACAMTPRQPDASDEGSYHFDQQDDNGLGNATFLATTNGYTQCQTCGKEYASK